MQRDVLLELAIEPLAAANRPIEDALKSIAQSMGLDLDFIEEAGQFLLGGCSEMALVRWRSCAMRFGMKCGQGPYRWPIECR